MHSFMSWVLAAGLTLTVVCQADGAPSVGQRPAARPVDAVAAILGAFRTHPVVALDEEHADERSHAFRLTLIRDPRFPFVVNDVVVEFGNALHQDVMDRFVIDGPLNWLGWLATGVMTASVLGMAVSVL